MDLMLDSLLILFPNTSFHCMAIYIYIYIPYISLYGKNNNVFNNSYTHFPSLNIKEKETKLCKTSIPLRTNDKIVSVNI